MGTVMDALPSSTILRSASMVRDQRGHIGDFTPVAHALVGEERIREERELQRCNRTLDRHLDDMDDIDDQAPALPRLGLLPFSWVARRA